MSFTVADILTKAQSDLKDTYEGSRTYTPREMAGYAGEGIVELRRVRPSTRYDMATGELFDDDDSWIKLEESQTNLTAPVEGRYFPALVAYVIYKCMMRDVTDEGNKDLADKSYKRFAQIASQ